MDKGAARKTPRDLALEMAKLLRGYTAVEIMTAISTLSAAVFTENISVNRNADPNVFLDTFEKTFLMALEAIVERRKRQRERSH